MKKYILVVDDSETVRASAKFSLEEAGYDVQTAENGKDALEKLDQINAAGDRVVLILCDINMPVMDGITFIKTVKQIAAFRFIPIIVVTTETQDSKKLEGKSAGAAGWLTKPFNQEQLAKVIGKFVR